MWRLIAVFPSEMLGPTVGTVSRVAVTSLDRCGVYGSVPVTALAVLQVDEPSQWIPPGADWLREFRERLRSDHGLTVRALYWERVA